jgi:hypothetical protein
MGRWSLIRLAEPGAWHCVDVEFDAAGEFIGWYINFQEPSGGPDPTLTLWISSWTSSSPLTAAGG